MSALVSEHAKSPAVIRPGPIGDLGSVRRFVAGADATEGHLAPGRRCARLLESLGRTSAPAARPAYVSEAHLRAHQLVKELSRSGTCSVDQNDRRAASRMLRFLRVVQDEDPDGRLGALSLGGFSTFLRGTNTGAWGTAAAPEPSPTQLVQADHLEALASLDKAGRVPIEPASPSTKRTVVPEPMSARDVQPLREGLDWHRIEHPDDRSAPPEGEIAMSEQPTPEEVAAMSDDQLAALPPESSTNVVEDDNTDVRIAPDQRARPLGGRRD